MIKHILKFRKSEIIRLKREIQKFNDNQILLQKYENIYIQTKSICIENNEDEKHKLISIFIVVPKKNIKKAVNRNKIKRRIRESYRLNYSIKLIIKNLIPFNKRILIRFKYIYNEVVSYKIINRSILEGLNDIKQKLDGSNPLILLRTDKILDAVNNFEYNIKPNQYSTIHIGGTNGKGSISTMIAHLLANQYKTGLFTSPHIKPEDHIKIINDSHFKPTLILNYGDLTPFELLTLSAFKSFTDEKVDYGIFEVGMGGLLDATNIINPQLIIISNIDYDHMNYLGKSLKDIEKHKLGIIKDNIPIVTTCDQVDEYVKSHDFSNDIHIYGKDFNTSFIKYDGEYQYIRFKNENIEFEYKLSLLGDYQIINSGLAIQGFWINQREKYSNEEIINMITSTLDKIKWNCRFEIMKYNDKTIIFDGAHNPAGAKVLRESLNKYYPNKDIFFIIGCLRDKNYMDIINTLITNKDKLILTLPQSSRAWNPQKVKEMFNKALIIEDYYSIIEYINQSQNDIICITGSLYCVEVMKPLFKE